MTLKTKKKKTDPQMEFVNLTSHQLRTPLSGTKWLLELLEKSDKGNLNKKQKEYIEKIYASNEHVIALVNDLLEVSSIEEGKARLYLQSTDLPVIIRDLLREKEREVKKKHLKISFTTEQEPFPRVQTEPNKIKQAINNLVSNAIAFTATGGKIDIDLRQEGEFIQVSVADTGVGIPKSQQKQVFNKFFRGSNVVQMETTGTGLGLFIAKAFIKASGGKLWFKSQEGKGTTFFFTLPKAK
jgi:signal transduction histidine kinase